MNNKIILKFLRGSPMEARPLRLLQDRFKKEMEDLRTKPGCTRCKQNGLRKKYRKKLQTMGPYPEEE